MYIQFLLEYIVFLLGEQWLNSLLLCLFNELLDQVGSGLCLAIKHGLDIFDVVALKLLLTNLAYLSDLFHIFAVFQISPILVNLFVFGQKISENGGTPLENIPDLIFFQVLNQIKRKLIIMIDQTGDKLDVGVVPFIWYRAALENTLEIVKVRMQNQLFFLDSI